MRILRRATCFRDWPEPYTRPGDAGTFLSVANSMGEAVSAALAIDQLPPQGDDGGPGHFRGGIFSMCLASLVSCDRKFRV